MTNEEIYDYYKSIPRGEKAKVITEHYNSMDVLKRKAYMQYLESFSAKDYKTFKTLLRGQAVKDFWTQERKNICEGKNTRNWTPEQIEAIMNLDADGTRKLNGGAAFQIDAKGNKIVDAKNNTSYYGHHMVDVHTHPELAGDWRNIQALDYL